MPYGILTSLARWESNDNNHQFKRSEFLYLNQRSLAQTFRDLFGPIHKASILELGCGGGLFCCQMIRWIGLDKIASAAGIDWSEQLGQDFKANVNNLGLPTTFIQANLLDPGLLSLAHKSDIVISGGLVEHFVGLDFHRILNLHSQLLRTNGKLVISFPNLLGVRYLWHRLFDHENLNDHSLDAMKPEIVRDFYQESGFRIDLVAYYGLNRLWWNPQDPRKKITRVAGNIILKIYNNIPISFMNRLTLQYPSFMSPYCLIIATKTG